MVDSGGSKVENGGVGKKNVSWIWRMESRSPAMSALDLDIVVIGRLSIGCRKGSRQEESGTSSRSINDCKSRWAEGLRARSGRACPQWVFTAQR